MKYVIECTADQSLDRITRKKRELAHAHELNDQVKLIKLADKYVNVCDLLDQDNFTDDKMKWTDDKMRWFVHWCFAVCRKMSGINTIIDERLTELFKRHHVNITMTDDELDEYPEVK
jgi:hypothetical protein